MKGVKERNGVLRLVKMLIVIRTLVERNSQRSRPLRSILEKFLPMILLFASSASTMIPNDGWITGFKNAKSYKLPRIMGSLTPEKDGESWKQMKYVCRVCLGITSKKDVRHPPDSARRAKLAIPEISHVDEESTLQEGIRGEEMPETMCILITVR